MIDDLDARIEKLANEKLANLLSVIDMSKIVTLDKFGLIYIGGQKADEVRLDNLKSEAEVISQMELWTILHETPKELAQKAMFVSGESLVDMQKGRSMLYTLSSQKGLVDLFRSYVHKK